MISEMGIAGCEFTESIADTDHRTAIKQIGGHPLVLHPTAVDDAVFVFAAKPVATS